MGGEVVHLDDLATHEELFGWTGRFRDWVLEPFSRGEPGRVHPYDWNTRLFGPPRLVPAADVVLVEGVGGGRRAVRPHLAGLVWMDRGPQESWARGRRRDGPPQTAFWDGWTVAESRHFAGDPSRPFAGWLVRECPEGYEWLPGPAEATPPPPARHAR
ncbi:hypothetical protein C6N75_29360 [Streptomyces solincola]|uniref:Uridine kinase n=1 Tax=Streptomyces solincola TaxID=2100817 RepID=A0A2S9PMT3_9ACTN|nr:hypothetical protein [Streptomyces solincola]PRH75739.1 hypothetical protein C6N75_29360 [Streptomyces solincola]